MRGGGSFVRNRNRGGFGAGPSGSGMMMNGGAMPTGAVTDTLHVNVSNCHYPVTEDMIRKVFAHTGNAPTRVSVMPGQNPSESIAIVQFMDPSAACTAHNMLNGRDIYSKCNRMNISYTNYEAFVQGNNGYGTGGHRSGSGMLPMPNNGSNAAAFVPAPMGMPTPNSYMNPPPTGAYATGMGAYPVPPSPNGQAAAHLMYPGNPASGNFMNPPQQHMGGSMGRGMARGMGRGMARGMGRGTGRGMMGHSMMGVGRGGMDPQQLMLLAASNAGFNPMAFSGFQLGAHAGGHGGNGNLGPTVFLSITLVPEETPLQHLFLVLEAFGGVVTIRRNHSNRKIVTAKMASPQDADAVVQHLRHVPFAGGQISAKRFPSYVERNPCNDEGDPMDAGTIQYDFTTSRHRSPGQRSKATPSAILKLTGCQAFSEAEVTAYLSDKGFYPEELVQSEDGSFRVVVEGAEVAVKLLIAAHNNVCGEERSNVIFLEGPAPAEEAGKADGSVTEGSGAPGNKEPTEAEILQPAENTSAAA